jgi:MurNAc alpha-1-phosphate uridylyltransferase
VRADGENPLTYAGLGVYRPQILDDWRSIVGDLDPPRFRLAPILKAYMPDNKITGEHHTGQWTDVGTPERLGELDRRLDFDTPSL